MRFVAEIEMEIEMEMEMEMMVSLTEMLDSTVMPGKEEAERHCPLSIVPLFIQSSGRGAPRCRVLRTYFVQQYTYVLYSQVTNFEIHCVVLILHNRTWPNFRLS